MAESSSVHDCPYGREWTVTCSRAHRRACRTMPVPRSWCSTVSSESPRWMVCAGRSTLLSRRRRPVLRYDRSTYKPNHCCVEKRSVEGGPDVQDTPVSHRAHRQVGCPRELSHDNGEKERGRRCATRHCVPLEKDFRRK